MKRLVIKDRPGALSVAVMRAHFERVFADTTGGMIAGDLAIEEQDGAFYCYRDEHVDRFWVGFAIGMRAAERLEAERRRLADVRDRHRWPPP